MVFITGWNEWIAGRFKEFNGIREPVMFVDQFDQEHSRDIEPMRGGHGDHYYYQMTAFIRRYKGTRAVPPVRSGAIQIDGRFEDWAEVSPEFRDTVDDPVRRAAPGWDPRVIHRNDSGRNDILAAKVSSDSMEASFYVRTRAPLTPSTGSNWMILLLDVDANPTNGWLGYDFVLNRIRPGSIERHTTEGFKWAPVGVAAWRMVGAELEVAIPWRMFGRTAAPPFLDFKWGDGLQLDGHWSDLTLNGDAAPNDRFNYRAILR